MSFHLANAEQLAKEANNGEFTLPNKKKRESLEIGDWAYIVFTPDDDENDERPGERFWVQILRRNENGSYVGCLNLQLIHYPVTPGTEITFEPKHIYNLLTSQKMERSDRIYRVMGPYAALLYQTEGYKALAESEAELDGMLDEWELNGNGQDGRKATTYSKPSLTNRIPNQSS